MASWCSRLARQPVTLEVDGSSPFGVAKIRPELCSGLTHASVAQLVEQRTENPRVVGSIPTGGTTVSNRGPKCGCSSSGRAPPCQGGGSEFEPRHPLQQKSSKLLAWSFFAVIFALRRVLLLRSDICFASVIGFASFGGEYNITSAESRNTSAKQYHSGYAGISQIPMVERP